MDRIAEMPLSKGKFNSNAELSYTLPAHYYFDPDIMRLESENIWMHSWLIAGYTHDLPEPGSYRTSMIAGQPVLIVRGKDLKIRAFYNVCRHRGHLLLDGCGHAGGIRCRFHSWAYDLTGRLIAAPNSEAVPGFDKSEFHLAEIRVEEVAGRMIFVNFDEDAKSFDEVYPGLVADIIALAPKFDRLIWTRRDEYTIKANWKSTFDGLECYHCPYLHPGSMGGPNDRMQPSFESTDFEYYARHIIRGNPDIMDTSKAAQFGVTTGADLKDLNMWYVWPNILFMAHPGPANFKVAHIWPTGPESSVRYIDQFTLTDPPSEYDLRQMANHKITFLEDVGAMESVQIGLHARGYTSGRLMVDRERSWKSEHATHHFQNLVWEALNPSNKKTRGKDENSIQNQ